MLTVYISIEFLSCYLYALMHCSSTTNQLHCSGLHRHIIENDDHICVFAYMVVTMVPFQVCTPIPGITIAMVRTTGSNVHFFRQGFELHVGLR